MHTIPKSVLAARRISSSLGAADVQLSKAEWRETEALAK